MRLLAHPERGCDCLRNQLGIVQGREVYKPHAVLKLTLPSLCHLQRQARLTAASRTGEGHEARPAKQSLYLCHLALPPDKASELDRQVTGTARSGKPWLLPLSGPGSVQVGERHAAARELHKGSLLGSRNAQDLRQRLRQFLGGFELRGFQFTDGDLGAAGAPRQLVLRQVEDFALPPHPLAKSWRSLPRLSPLFAPRALSVHFVSQIVSLNALM